MSDAAIVRMPSRPGGWEPTAEQEKMVRDMFLSGAPPLEAKVLLEVAKARKLNPLTRQIHFVKRWDTQKNEWVWATQVGIDGFRSIAERTGLYDGQDEPEYEHDAKTGALLKCRVKVYRRDWSRPSVGVAYFSEYAQTKKDGALNSMWARGPHFMLAKCAEAIAFRKAFPEDMGGLYEPAELGADAVDAAPEAPAAPKVTAKEAARAKAAQLAAGVPRPTIEAPKPRASAVVVDVAPGETEEQAERRYAQPEPPPPSDEDAPPHDAKTGELREPAKPMAPEVVVPYGKDKGKKLSEVSDRTLAWLEEAVGKAIGEPAKARWRDDNLVLLGAIEVEIRNRVSEGDR